MEILTTDFDGLFLIKPKVFKDTRGSFHQIYQSDLYNRLNIPPLVQDNMSQSVQNTLRGLHYQKPYAQGKLVWVSRGKIWDVAIDIRKSSKTFGKWFGITLTAEDFIQLYIPPGFAHGFCVLSPEADFQYKCTEYYTPQSERSIAWNDPDLNIPWPISEPLLSPKDSNSPLFSKIHKDHLFD